MLTRYAVVMIFLLASSVALAQPVADPAIYFYPAQPTPADNILVTLEGWTTWCALLESVVRSGGVLTINLRSGICVTPPNLQMHHYIGQVPTGSYIVRIVRDGNLVGQSTLVVNESVPTLGPAVAVLLVAGLALVGVSKIN